MTSLPNLLVPGVTKAGTTSLYSYLCQHPEIDGGDMKEINFFSPLKDGGALPPVAELAGHFPGADDHRYRLDVSPQYLHGGTALIEGVARVLPGASVLIMLRDPVPRLASAFGMQRFKGKLPEDMTYEGFVGRCLAVAEHGVQVPADRRFRALAVADYGTHVPLWLDRFPGSVRVGFTEQLKADPGRFVGDVCAWLDLPTMPVVDFAVRNRTFQHRSRRIGALAQRVNSRVGRTLEQHPRLKHRVRGAYSRLNGETGSGAAPTAVAESRVRTYYAPSVERLRDVLEPGLVIGETYPPWLTEYPSQ